MRQFLNFLCLVSFILFLSSSLISSEFVDHLKFNTVRVCYKYVFTDILGEEVTNVSHASAIILSPTLIITNAHVVHQKPPGILYAYVSVPKKRGNETEKVALSIKKFDIEKDLLLLEMKELKNWTPIIVAMETPEVGDKIYWSGFKSLKFVPMIRVGFYMESREWGIYLDPGFYGDSGGGVFNEKGELVGLIYKTWALNYEHTIKVNAVTLDKIQEFLK